MINNISKTLIIGPGALGLGLGGLLSRNSEVFFLGRKPKSTPHFDFLKDDQTDSIKAKWLTPESLPSHDFNQVWITTPAYAVKEAAQTLKILRKSPELILVCSNGLGIYDECQAILGKHSPLCRALVEVGFKLEQNAGHPAVRITGQPKVIFATKEELFSQATDIAASLRNQGWITEVNLNPAEAEWHKVIFNIFVNPTASILGCENGGILGPALPVALSAANEAKKVAAALGFNTSTLGDNALKDKIQYSSKNICSTLAQLRQGRRTEIDYITGAVIAAAERLLIETPTLRALHFLLKSIESQSCSDRG